MGLPFSRQPLGDFIQVHDLSHREVARALRCNAARVNSLLQGRAYPIASEIEALERLFGLPVQVMFEPEVLKYFNPNGSLFSPERRESEGLQQ